MKDLDLDDTGLTKQEKELIRKLCQPKKEYYGKAIFISPGGELLNQSFDQLFNDHLQEKLNKGEITYSQFLKLAVYERRTE